MEDYSDLIARLNARADAFEGYVDQRRPAAHEMRRAAVALTRLSQRVAELEIMRSGEQQLKEIAEQRAKEWCAKVAALESQLAARESVEPYGYAPENPNGNYFTKNKATADYVGSMIPVYTQPAAAARESADLSIAERNAMARLNDCNSTPTPADRNILIKLVERLCGQPAAAASEDKRYADYYRWLRRRAWMLDCSDSGNMVLTLTYGEGPTGEFLDDQMMTMVIAGASLEIASQKEQKE